MKSRWLVICIMIVLGISGCSLMPDKVKKNEEIIRAVEIEEVSKERNPIVINYLGAVIVNNERTLFSNTTGKVGNISINVGDQVMKEDELLTLKENDSNNHNVYTDVDGYIKEILIEEEALIEAGDPLITVSSYNHRVTLGITSKDIKKIDIGTKANLQIDGHQTSGRICFISPYPDEESRTFPVQIELDSTYDKEDFIVGAVTEVELIIGEEDGIYLDINNVRNEGNAFVYIVGDDNRAKKQEIKIKSYRKNHVLIEGLNEGDKVIISGTSNLKNGQKVKILDADEVGV